MMSPVPPTTVRRLAVGLMTAAGALLFATLNLIGAGVSSGDKLYAAKVSSAVYPLAFSLLGGFCAFVFVEIASLKSTPQKGHPHSKQNYLDSAITLVSVFGLSLLLIGGYALISSAVVAIPAAK